MILNNNKKELNKEENVTYNQDNKPTIMNKKESNIKESWDEKRNNDIILINGKQESNGNESLINTKQEESKSQTIINIKDENEVLDNQFFTSSILCLKQAIIQQLDEGIKLISSISDPILFIKKSNLVPKSTIGKHFRHVLDHFYCLFKGIEEKEIIVDYDLRVREKSLELEPNKMMEAMKELIIKIEHMNLESELNIKVKSIIEPCKSKFIISKSSLIRELWFCTHHAIHHHALIKVLCFEFNIKTNANFGVAPSTLYKRQLSKDNIDTTANPESKHKKITKNKQ